MSDGLERLVALLSQVSSDDLLSLRQATEGVPQLVPGLLAWLEHAVGWELDRRAGRNYRLGRPSEAIPPEEEAVSVAAVLAMAAPFRQPTGRETVAIATLLEHVAALITSDGRTLN